MDEFRDLTRTLMSVPSHEDETAAGDAIEAWLHEETNADVARNDAGNAVARVDPGVGESLTLVGYHGIVPPTDRQTADSGDYMVETRGGRLYGHGAADMKDAVTVSMLTFRGAAADADSEVAFTSFISEEIGEGGVHAALSNGFELGYAVIAEGSTNYSGPNRADVAVTHRGRRANTPVASGTACHASGPERSENAVYRATDTVDVVHGLFVSDAEVLDHSVSGSIAIAEISGRSAWNVIPDRCEVILGERTAPSGFAGLARTAELEGVEWVVEQDLPPMVCDDAGFAERVLDAARSVHEARSDTEPEQTAKPHATDAGWLAQAETTCVVYGPSGPGEAYTKDENMLLDVLVWCYETYRTLVANQ